MTLILIGSFLKPEAKPHH